MHTGADMLCQNTLRFWRPEPDLGLNSSKECYPVLSIDDAERIYTYLGKDNYPGGKMILEIFINFLTTTPIHVVVSSTNVHHLLEHMHNRTEIMVIGDLVRDDAQQFWELTSI